MRTQQEIIERRDNILRNKDVICTRSVASEIKYKLEILNWVLGGTENE